MSEKENNGVVQADSESVSTLKSYGSKNENSIHMNLEETLLLSIGPRVMLMFNLSIKYGLVNGTCGTITNIIYENEAKFGDDLEFVFQGRSI